MAIPGSSRFFVVFVLLAAWWLPASSSHAANVAVTNCNDAGPGSLRNAAAIALDDDVIDLRGLTCSRILLTTGPVIFGQFRVTLQGPGLSKLAIDGGGRSSVLRHHITGTGASARLIRIRDLTVRWGAVSESVIAFGGCLYSGGSIELVRVSVHHCVARSTVQVLGGGVSARRNLRVIDSLVYENRAITPGREAGLAGGAYGGYTLLLERSRLSRNHADVAGGGLSNVVTAHYSTISHNQGGGVLSQFGGDIQRSTFSGNDTYGLYINEGTVQNSTFSGNTGPGLIGESGNYWQNTIAYNTVPRSESGLCRGGMDLQNAQAQLRGNLMAHNTCDGMPLDFSRRDSTLFSPSSRNLIMYATGPVPPDTLTSDPRIGPLADNGGPTWTHALLKGSPAIDRGSSAEVGEFDQRGPGFLRRVCLQADIGAYEYQCTVR